VVIIQKVIEPKVGCIIDKKVAKKKKNSILIYSSWLPCGTCHKKDSGDFGIFKKNLISGKFGPFFHQKTFVWKKLASSLLTVKQCLQVQN